MSHASLRKDIENCIEEENIEITELIGEAIDNLLEIIDEEEDRKDLDIEEEDDD